MKRIVQNRLTRTDGRPLVGEKVTIKLIVPSWADSGVRELVKTVYADTDTTGLWTVDLEVNADVDPPGTYYTVRETQGVIHSFVVPAGSAPVWLRSLLVAPPPPVPELGIVLPPGGLPGQFLGLDADGVLAWLDAPTGSASPNLIFGAGVYGAGVYSPAA